jgi:hypothetical protein
MALTAPLGALQLWRSAGGRWRDADRWESLTLGSVALFFSTMVAALLGFALA